MDNASKALIMAGGILIAIMVASLFVYLFTTYGRYAENMYDRINQRQITEANNEYTKYEGASDNTIYDVVTVANKAKDHNTSLNLTNGERGYIRVGILGENSNIEKLNNEDISKLLQKYADETRFNCNVSETTEGLISSVIFTKR
jgi:hypothetical protein